MPPSVAEQALSASFRLALDSDLHMQTTIFKRSVVLKGHKTSVSLEEDFWDILTRIAASKRVVVSEVISQIDNNRQEGNLSSAIRLFVLQYVQKHGDPGVASRSGR
jgi:predicted DNA-binding ribbon-helix-helix protein